MKHDNPTTIKKGVIVLATIVFRIIAAFFVYIFSIIFFSLLSKTITTYLSFIFCVLAIFYVIKKNSSLTKWSKVAIVFLLVSSFISSIRIKEDIAREMDTTTKGTTQTTTPTQTNTPTPTNTPTEEKIAQLKTYKNELKQVLEPFDANITVLDFYIKKPKVSTWTEKEMKTVSTQLVLLAEICNETEVLDPPSELKEKNKKLLSLAKELKKKLDSLPSFLYTEAYNTETVQKTKEEIMTIWSQIKDYETEIDSISL